MKYRNFEDVPVWKDGIDLTAMVFRLTEDKAFRFRGDIANQMQRAALSIPNNIAEGFERGTTQELIAFLYYAKGSAGEVRSICHALEKVAFFQHLKSEISNLKSLARDISRQLSGWTASLQETDIRGPRHLTEKSKGNWDQKKRAEALMERLRKDQEELLASLKNRSEKEKKTGSPE